MMYQTHRPTVIVDKVDDKGNPVKDAQLQITVKDSNGNAVASWKTDETSYDIIGKLIAGNTYILEETTFRQVMLQQIQLPLK